MISYSSKYRSTQDEILDNFDIHGPEVELMLKDLTTVNKILGGHRVTLQGICILLKGFPKDKTITIVDVGCGDGEMLRKIAEFEKECSYTFNLIGIDGNEHIIKIAKEKSKAFQNISFNVRNIFSEDAIVQNYDIALCTLFLHHFNNEAIISIFNKLSTGAKVGIIVNDLHRSRTAFWLFKIFSSIFIKSKIAKHDGLVSVARGFKRKELNKIAAQIPNTTAIIHWKWAFRWQFILRVRNVEKPNKRMR